MSASNEGIFNIESGDPNHNDTISRYKTTSEYFPLAKSSDKELRMQKAAETSEVTSPSLLRLIRKVVKKRETFHVISTWGRRSFHFRQT